MTLFLVRSKPWTQTCGQSEVVSHPYCKLSTTVNVQLYSFKLLNALKSFWERHSLVLLLQSRTLI